MGVAMSVRVRPFPVIMDVPWVAVVVRVRVIRDSQVVMHAEVER